MAQELAFNPENLQDLLQQRLSLPGGIFPQVSNPISSVQGHFQSIPSTTAYQQHPSFSLTIILRFTGWRDGLGHPSDSGAKPPQQLCGRGSGRCPYNLFAAFHAQPLYAALGH
jgi:hypothetical protein